MASQAPPTFYRLVQPGLRRVLRRAGTQLVRHPGWCRAQVLRHRGIDRVIDVGANTGQYASDLRRFGFDGEIISFEPLADAYRKLAVRAARDPLWRTEKLALGDVPGSADINVAANSVSSSLLPMMERHRRAAPESEYAGRESVDVQRLDDVLTRYPAHSPEKTLLKIDTQGFERQVLLGASDLVRRVGGLQIELSVEPLYSGQMLYDEALRMVTAYGLRLVSIESGFGDRETREMLQFDGIFFRETEKAPV